MSNTDYRATVVGITESGDETAAVSVDFLTSKKLPWINSLTFITNPMQRAAFDPYDNEMYGKLFARVTLIQI